MTEQEIKENIIRLEATITANYWNTAYKKNCEKQIIEYKKQLDN